MRWFQWTFMVLSLLSSAALGGTFPNEPSPTPALPPLSRLASHNAAMQNAPGAVVSESAALSDGLLSGYLDDRSTPQALMQSWANSINRREFLRTYSYWERSAPLLKPFPQFAAGYAQTASVQLLLGTITSDHGAGQTYYSVPVTLIATTIQGARQTFVGCYILHLANPSVQGMLPFQPLAIQSARVFTVANFTNTAWLMANACQIVGQPLPPAPPPYPADISAARYLDDRSDAVQVLRSLFNAVNRKEYLRAYSYWEPGAAELKSLDQFAQGYANTKSVQLIAGSPLTDAGAGQFYFKVPVTLFAQTGDGATQTFVGCYTLHISNPSIQGTPPFQPLAISAARVSLVANGQNPTVLMSQSCQ